MDWDEVWEANAALDIWIKKQNEAVSKSKKSKGKGGR